MTGLRRIAFAVLLALAGTVPAQARYNPGWEWRTLRHDRFTIYYPAGHEAFARRIYALGDEVSGDVAGYFGADPARCPVVLNPGTDRFNGWYTAFPNRISLYETPLNNISGFEGGSDLADLVFTHEYTHFVHVTLRGGWYGALSRVFGDGLAVTNAFAPGWMTEGIAVELETRFTDGGRGDYSLFRAQLRSFTDDGTLWGLTEAGTVSPNRPPLSRFYLTGYALVEYMHGRYGDGTFAAIVRRQALHPFLGARFAIGHVTGRSPEGFYRAFQRDYLSRADSLRAVADADPLSEGTVLAGNGLDGFSDHAWTAAGTIVALRTGWDAPPTFVELDPSDGRVIRDFPLGTTAHYGRFRLMPDGSFVLPATVYHPLGGGELDTAELIRLDPATGNIDRLTRGAHIFDLALDPAGTWLVVARRNGMWIDLAVTDQSGDDARLLAGGTGYLFERPVWSPDGSVVVAVAKTGHGTALVTVDPASGAMHPLFDPEGHAYGDPAFSPDGRWIVFGSDRGGAWDIYAWDIYAWDRRGGELRRLTAVRYAAQCPRVSPDGRTLSFISLREGVGLLCTMPFDPASGRPVRVLPLDELPPPDLARLAPENGPAPEGIPFREAYRPFIHAPVAASDEDGTMAGVFVMGADPLGITAYQGSILYGFDSGRPGYDLMLTNRSFWPDIFLRAYDTTLEGNTLTGSRDIWYRERGAEVSAGISVIHESLPRMLTGSYRLGFRVRRFDGLDGLQIDPASDRTTAVFADMAFGDIDGSARRDMVPPWSRVMRVSHEKALDGFGGELPGHNTIVTTAQSLPAPFRHDTVICRVAFQGQAGQVAYDRDVSLPRGYTERDVQGGFDRLNTMVASLEYVAPLWYADTGIGLMLWNLNLLRGSLFVDYGAGWNGAFRWDDWAGRARTSLGGTVTAEAMFMSWIPVEVGFAGGYLPREGNWFVRALYGLDVSLLERMRIPLLTE